MDDERTDREAPMEEEAMDPEIRPEVKPEDRLSRDRDEVRTSFKVPKEAKKSRWPTRTVR